jgi:hypothetical protein
VDVALLVAVLLCGLVVLLVWGFRRAGDGPGVTPGPSRRDHDSGTR